MSQNPNSKLSMKSLILIVVVSVLPIPLTSMGFDYLRSYSAKREILARMKKEEIFQVIFENFPDAENKMKSGLNQILSLPASEIPTRSELFSRQFIQEYLDQSVPLASDEAVANLLSWNAMLLGRLQADPVGCVDYYLGRRTPPIVMEGQNYTVVQREGQLKAAIIRSAKQTPQPAEPFANLDEALKVLARRYVESRQDLASAANLTKVAVITPEEGCKAARAFTTALAEGPQAETARLYKYLTAAAKAEKR